MNSDEHDPVPSCFICEFFVSCIVSCVLVLSQINIFNLDKADSVKDIDRAILYALLKGGVLPVSHCCHVCLIDCLVVNFCQVSFSTFLIVFLLLLTFLL